MTTLVTHCTANWLHRLKPYLASLSKHSPWPTALLVVDRDAPAEFMADLPGVSAVRVPVADGSPEPTQSYQHGAFLPYVAEPGVIIYTDGDIVMQRPPSLIDQAEFDQLPANTVMCGWNSGPDETLAVEALRLFPKVGMSELVHRFGGGIYRAPCYNVGVIAARRETWQKLYDAYMGLWPLACDSFAGPARQQWLMSYCLRRFYFEVKIMPYAMHMHGCYSLPAGAEVGPQALYHGEPVLFRHHL